MQAIQNVLELKRRNHPNWKASSEAIRMSLFVKNLENVQGDEREGIFISIGMVVLKMAKCL
jgi:superfamily I DNA and/or RNA helicase